MAAGARLQSIMCARDGCKKAPKMGAKKKKKRSGWTAGTQCDSAWDTVTEWKEPRIGVNKGKGSRGELPENYSWRGWEEAGTIHGVWRKAQAVAIGET